MSSVAERRCTVCGDSTRRIESNHVAARANDRTLLLPMCKSCHGVFTDWQWRLGILKRESLRARTDHSEHERVWALFEGLALTALMAGPGDHNIPWIRLARAAGSFYKIREEQEDRDERWGPKPAHAREARDRPARRGDGNPRALLAVVLDAGDKLQGDDAAWLMLKSQIVEVTSAFSGLEAVPLEWQDAVDMLLCELRDLGAASGPDELATTRAQREATLLAIQHILD